MFMCVLLKSREEETSSVWFGFGGRARVGSGNTWMETGSGNVVLFGSSLKVLRKSCSLDAAIKATCSVFTT